MLLRKFLKS